MPSIPQSLLWISLVVLWLFVLVPMLVSKRDAVRRTSDVALATRVLNSGAAARLLKRGGPAAGHRSNPDWQPDEDEYDNLDDLDSDDTEEMPLSRGAVVTVAAAVSVEETEPDDLPEDLDVDADDAELGRRCPRPRSSPSRWPRTRPDDEDTEAEFETEDADDEAKPSRTRTPINTNTSTTPPGYRSPRNRRRPSHTRSRGGIDTTRTPPLRSAPANTPSASGC